MKVESASASYLAQQAKTRAQNHQIQNVFSEVLREAGRQGFASAQEVEGDHRLSESIESSWSSWFDVELGGRYRTAERPEQLKRGFGEILSKAYAEGGYVEPKDFLNRLSKEELQVVQNVHWLAKSIDVDSLTGEGSLNLLLPPAAQVDLNNDGLTQSGLAYGLKFPDSNTPAKVVEAWEEATAQMEQGERMMYELQMKLPILTANMFVDENGAYSHHYEPGDPEFTNPLAASDYSYLQSTQDQLDHLEFVKNWISKDQYQQQTEFWNRLQGLLAEKGVR